MSTVQAVVLAVAGAIGYILLVFGLSSWQTRRVAKKGDADTSPIELARFENEARKTNATILGAVGVVCSIAAGLFTIILRERQLDEDRFRSAVQLLGASESSTRTAGVYELIQTPDYAPTRVDTADGVLRAFVEREHLDASSHELNRVKDFVSSYVAGVLPEPEASAVRDKFIRFIDFRLMAASTDQWNESPLMQELHTEHSDLYHRIMDELQDANPQVSVEAKIAMRHLGRRRSFVMRDFDLRGMRFEGDELSDFASLSGWDLRSCTFHLCDLSGIDFAFANLQDCRFLSCNLRNCNFSDVDFGGASLEHCNLTGAKLDEGALDGVSSLHFTAIDDKDAISESAKDRFTVELFDDGVEHVSSNPPIPPAPDADRAVDENGPSETTLD